MPFKWRICYLRAFLFFAALVCNAALADPSPDSGSIEVKVLTKNNTNNVYLFRVPDLGRFVDQQKILILTQKDQPLMVMKVLKKYPEQSAIAAGNLQFSGAPTVLQVGELFKVQDASNQSFQSSPTQTPSRTWRSSSPSPFHLQLSPFFAVNSTSSTDLNRLGTFTLSSQVYAGLDSEISVRAGRTFRPYISARVAYIRFAPLTQTTKTLTQPTNLLTSFRLGAFILLSPKVNLGVFAGLEKDLFLFSASTLAVAQEGIFIPTGGGSLAMDLIRSRKFALRGTGFYALKLGASTANYTVQAGKAYGGKLGFVSLSDNDERFAVELNGLYRDQGTNTAKQIEMLFGLAAQIYL